MTDLKSCPFCNGEAEMDTSRYFAKLGGGTGKAVSIYCRECSADYTICRDDVPELSAEDCVVLVETAWNTRHLTPMEAAAGAMLEALAELATVLGNPNGLDRERVRPAYDAAVAAITLATGEIG